MLSFQQGVSIFFFSSRRRHTRSLRDWSSDVCSSDLVTGFGQYRVTLDAQAAGPFSLYGSSHSNVDLIGGFYRTRIAAVSLSAAPEAHQPFTLTGVAQVWNGAAWTGYAGMPVQYYYQVQGTTTWVYAGAAQTDASGGFSGTASVQPGQLD